MFHLIGNASNKLFDSVVSQGMDCLVVDAKTGSRIDLKNETRKNFSRVNS